MEEQKVYLRSMVDFVLNLQQERDSEDSTAASWMNPAIDHKVIVNYANFLKQELNLSMFVPAKLVNGVWVVLEEPRDYELYLLGIAETDEQANKCQEYQEAKERVLFEGVELNRDMYKSTKRKFWYIGELRIAHELTYHTGKIEFYFDISHDNSTIEDLVKYNLQLSSSAIKLLNL